METKDLVIKTEKNRKRLLEVVYKAKAGHIGGDLSCLNVLTALYAKQMHISPVLKDDPQRDRFILSKGHCVESLYVVLEDAGFLKPEVLDTLGQFGSILAGHPTVEVDGIEVNSGALGHGLGIGVGMAIAAKMNKESWKTYVLMGDGEQGEGSIYEAAMAAHQYKLDNLVAIIDRNHLQISGNTEDVMGIDNIHDRWTAFGWDVVSMNGDDMQSILDTFAGIDFTNGKPHLIVSETTKGKGVSFMENVASWHHGVPSEEQYQQAIKEISDHIAELEKNV